MGARDEQGLPARVGHGIPPEILKQHIKLNSMKGKLKTQHRKGIHIMFIFSFLHIYGGIEKKTLVLYLQTADCGNSPDVRGDIDIVLQLTSAKESKGGEALPRVRVAEDGGEGQHHRQAVHLGHVVVDQGQQGIKLQAGALQ